VPVTQRQHKVSKIVTLVDTKSVSYFIIHAKHVPWDDKQTKCSNQLHHQFFNIWWTLIFKFIGDWTNVAYLQTTHVYNPRNIMFANICLRWTWKLKQSFLIIKFHDNFKQFRYLLWFTEFSRRIFMSSVQKIENIIDVNCLCCIEIVLQ
jgi:hypothetical protein